MHTRTPRFLRWIEEAEGRRLRESALLEPDASRPPAAAATATAGHVLRIHIPPPRANPQTDRDGDTGGSLSCLARNSGI
jgi:hypothetical protein